MRDLSRDLGACAINTATLGFQAPIAEVIDAVPVPVSAASPPWRREIEGADVAAIARADPRGRGSLFRDTAGAPISRPRTAAPSSRTSSQTAAPSPRRPSLWSWSFVMVVGSLPPDSKDIAAARAQSMRPAPCCAIMARRKASASRSEPLHPVYAADRSCLSLLSEALDLCDAIEGGRCGTLARKPASMSIMCGGTRTSRATLRVLARRGAFRFPCLRLAVPTDIPLNDRGMMGDGIIDIPMIRRMIEDAGYTGLVEAEIFSAENCGSAHARDPCNLP